MEFTTELKDEIRVQLTQYCNNFTNKRTAANTLKNVSGSTVYSIVNGRYDNISDDMWKSIRAQLRVEDPATAWQTVDTGSVRDLMFCFKDAQESMAVSWAVAPAGSGKSLAADLYRRQNKNVFYVLCDEGMAKSDFAQALARSVGLRVNTQKKARDIIMQVIEEIEYLDDALFIFDEGDKLTDNILYYFITIYNHLKDKAGIVFLSTHYMERRMELGLRRRAKGYEELYSRIGRKFFEVSVPTAMDVYGICAANGLQNQKTINEVIHDAEAVGFDLRRVNRKIRAIKKKQQITA